MSISLIVILIWSISLLILGLSLLILIGSTRLSSKFFSLSIFTVSLWMAGVGMLILMQNVDYAIYNIRINYYLGNLIANMFYLFFVVFPDKKLFPKKIVSITFFIQLILFFIYIFTDYIISDIYFDFRNKSWIWEFGNFSLIFEITFVSLFFFSINRLVKSYQVYKNKFVKKNITFMLQTIIFGLLPATILCVLLPRMGIYDMNWIGPITQLIWIPIIFYSIIKYKLMSVKHIMSISLTILILIIFLLNFFADFTQLYIIKGLIFLFFILVIFYQINNLIREHNMMSEIRKTNLSLSKIITHQTKEVRKAYEIENRARKDLEKLNETKDQFIMLTQHNLRSPITTIKSELELLINGHNGKIDDTALNSIIRTKSSADRLSQIVDDFLNITTIKIGSQILKLATGNVKSIIENVINDLRLEVEEMRVKINYISSENIWPDIKMDINKIREALTIIIENAIKYNFDRGVINISNTIVDNNIILSIENTGVGITSEESQSIFNKLFYRGMRARERNPIGMGIGLQVAKAIISGHKGKISIESLGENYGACVEIILPINSYNEA